MCVEIRGVTSMGKDRCRYLSQFYLGDLEGEKLGNFD